MGPPPQYRSISLSSSHVTDHYRSGHITCSWCFLWLNSKITLNLQDAYIHMPIHPGSRKQFSVNGWKYKFLLFPFLIFITLWLFTWLQYFYSGLTSASATTLYQLIRTRSSFIRTPSSLSNYCLILGFWFTQPSQRSTWYKILPILETDSSSTKEYFVHLKMLQMVSDVADYPNHTVPSSFTGGCHYSDFWHLFKTWLIEGGFTFVPSRFGLIQCGRQHETSQ